MKRQAYYPSRVADQLVWLENFHNKITPYQATLSLSPAQVTAAIADARFLIYVIGSWLATARPWSLSCTKAATEAMTGDGTNLCVLPVFTPPALPAGVGPVKTGALDRIFTLVATIKNSGDYTEAIGSDLGILGTSEAAPDLATVQPILTATVNGGRVDIGWSWEGNAKFLDMCEIQVDRGDGKGWSLLAFDTTPNYTDNAPFPTTLTRWKYRAIYHLDDAQVGQWSAEVSVTVGG